MNNFVLNTNVKIQKGFTLVELLVTVAVLATLGNLAIPSMARAVSKWQRDGATRAIIDHLQLARSTAITSAKRVVMCNSTDGSTCAEATQKEWKHGWLIFQDDNANKELDASDKVIAVAGPASGVDSMRSSNGVRRFVFLPSGLMAAGMSSLVIIPRNGLPMKIVVNRIGRLRLSEEKPDEPT